MLTWKDKSNLSSTCLADKIVHIHASNNDGSEDQHYGVEDGNIDYNWFAETLKKIGYDKIVIVESMT